MRTATDRTRFEPTDGSWSDYAAHGGLRSVLDPRDEEGIKNAYIDAMHKTALRHAGLPQAHEVVLDYGCGTGRLTRYLAPRSRAVVGTDITSAMLRGALAEGGAPNTVFSHIDGVRLPLRDASVDLVVSVYVLQYFVAERDAYCAVLQELARVLKPGGRCIFIEQVSYSGTCSGSVVEGAGPHDYLDGDAPARFRVLQQGAVRLARPGALVRNTLLRRGFPRFLRGPVQRAVLRRNLRRRLEDLGHQPYVDWMFHLKRED